VSDHEDRDRVLAALTPEDVLAHLQIEGKWHGNWFRSQRCAEIDDHRGDPFAMSRAGKWKCHACDRSGDLLALLAIGEGLRIREDFPKVLELAAGLAQVELKSDDFFGGAPLVPPRRPRPKMAPLPPLEDRVALARRRAVWTWDRLHDNTRLPEMYLRARGLDPMAVLAREELRSTPLRMPRPADDAAPDLRTLWWTMGTRRGTLSIVAPVRYAVDGSLVDLRARRVEPEPDQPKIIGLIGGVTESPAERGKPQQLIGCYGNPHLVDADLVVIVEGMLDYLTALMLWPEACVLGAVHAGSLSLVTAHAAEALAARDNTSKLLIVEQHDPPRRTKTGRVVSGAADAAINEDPNAAAKEALRLLGPARVGWLFCNIPGARGEPTPQYELGGNPVKDLNDLVRCRIDPHALVTWWPDIEGFLA